jgi:enoyl-CoA hydratase/carnithine racemase
MVSLNNFHQVIFEINTSPLPTVSAIIGYAADGGNIIAIPTD